MILLAALLWTALTEGSTPLFVLLDELDDLLEVIFLLTAGAAVCTIINCFLRRKSEKMSERET